VAKFPDTDYLYISSRLKAMERTMLSREKLGRMVVAKTGEEAVKVLTENGWNDFDPTDSKALETQIDALREELFSLLYRYSPDPTVIDVFRLRYDYHNLKTLVKSQALGLEADSLLSGAGSIPAVKLKTILREKSYHELGDTMRTALQEAMDVLARTSDPQLCDMILDRAMFAQMLAMAEGSESEFLMGYIRLSVDLSNLRVVTRAANANKGYDYLRRAVTPGGTIAPDRLYSEVTPDSVIQIFSAKDLLAPAAAAALALSGGSMAALDLACDNALMHYLRAARLIPFGESGVISYLLARENELTAVRIILLGRMAGLSEEQITERLRVSYV
jgi:V/A-type H+-transporting ATPase subunit C